MTPTILTFILDDDPSIATFIDKLLNKGSWRNGAFDALVAEYGAEAIVTAIKGHVSPDTGTNFKQQS